MLPLNQPVQSNRTNDAGGTVAAVSSKVASLVSLLSEMSHPASRHGDGFDELERSILETGPISIIVTDPAGIILAVNSAAERLTFYRRRELIEEHSLILLHDPTELSSHAVQLNEDSAEPIAAGIQSLTEKARQGVPEPQEWTYVRKDGSRISVTATITALRSPAGKVTGYLAVAFDITEYKKLSASMQRLESHDQLTGLPNRTLLLDRIAHGLRRATRYGQRLAVYLIDLDQFERFNATLGSGGGDAVLKHVSKQLLSAVRSSDTVARIGSDEFVVVMPDFRGPEDAERCAELLQHKLSTPVTVGDREIEVTAGIGISLYPECGKDVHELLSNANTAMRAAKSAGRASQLLYSSTQKTLCLDHLEIEKDLRRALDNNELFLEYQPQVECSDGAVTGFEALLRWRNRKRGIVPPAEFIPMAEDLGIMGPISEWVFQQACADCVELQKLTCKPLKVAINLSARQFAQRDLPSLVERTVRESTLQPEHLELEITEQMLMVNSERTLETLKAIRDLGVRIAIDDFGTGFSSFSYLLDYQVDRIKIDRSFVSKATVDSSAMAVTRAIIRMAHELKMRVVAEGVETEDQFYFLSQQECDAAQGYFFSRPVSKDNFVHALEGVKKRSAAQNFRK